jgi:hypothetical protein
MSNDTSFFPVTLLENAVTRPIAYQGKKYAVHISNELFVFDLQAFADSGRLVGDPEVITEVALGPD